VAVVAPPDGDFEELQAATVIAPTTRIASSRVRTRVDPPLDAKHTHLGRGGLGILDQSPVASVGIEVSRGRPVAAVEPMCSTGLTELPFLKGADRFVPLRQMRYAGTLDHGDKVFLVSHEMGRNVTPKTVAWSLCSGSNRNPLGGIRVGVCQPGDPEAEQFGRSTA
jgi:hypothetical protein